MVTIAMVRAQIADRAQIWPPNNQEPEIIGFGDGITQIFALEFATYIPGTLTVFSAPAPTTPGQPLAFTAVPANQYAIGSPVATTLAGDVAQSGEQTVALASMANVVPGTQLIVDVGAVQETIIVESISAEAITARFAFAHQPGASVSNALGVAAGGAVTQANAAVLTFRTAPAAGATIGARYQATAFSDDELQVYLDNALEKYDSDQLVLKSCTFDLIDVILMDQRRLEMIGQGDYRRDRSAFVNGLLKLKDALRLDLMGNPRPHADEAAFAFSRTPARSYTTRR